MSGQPNIYPNDASKFRQQYLANLALRANLDDKNLQANKIYKKTGMTPSQPTDTRTTTEKLADVERLKIDVRSQLSQIADGQNADSIVNQLDPVQLTFLAQHIEEIVKDIKPKYRYGIEADIFVPYLDAYMDKANQTNEVNFGLQQRSGNQILLNIQQIGIDMISPSQLNRVRDEIMTNSRGLKQNLHQSLLYDIEQLLKVLPSERYLEALTGFQNAILKEQIMEGLNDALRVLPTTQQVNDIMREYRQALQLKDAQALNEIASKLDQILTIDPATQDQMNLIKQLIEENVAGGGGGVPSAEATAVEGTLPPPPTKAKKLYEPTEAEIVELNKVYRPIESFGENPLSDDLLAYLNRLNDITGRNLFHWNEIGLSGSTDKSSRPKLLRAIKTANGKVRFYINEPKKMSGKGIRTRNRAVHHRIEGKGISLPEGIMPVSKYVPFGKYVIDFRRLNDDVVAIKLNDRGHSVPGFSPVKVGKGMGNILRDLINGGQPQYKDLASLTEEEKKYLHRIATRSSIIDRISIPAPDKTDDERDINQYEVMKGEILNGNDNAEMIKKFKLLISKMINKDLLPKGQAKEILVELATLGY
jgi:hypothetical protein